MPSNGGLKEHKDIISEILRERGGHIPTTRDEKTECSNIRDAKQILTSQGALINRLKLIEAELKVTQRETVNV